MVCAMTSASLRAGTTATTDGHAAGVGGWSRSSRSCISQNMPRPANKVSQTATGTSATSAIIGCSPPGGTS